VSLVFNPKVTGARRRKLLQRARASEQLPEDAAIAVRVLEYEIPDRNGNETGELICLITSILDPSDAPAAQLAAAYHERWEFEGCWRS